MTASFRACRLQKAVATLTIFLSLLACPDALAAETKRVMLLHSFGSDFKPWSEYAKSIRTELNRQSPWQLDIIDHSLVSARSDDTDAEGPFSQYLRALFAKHPLDLIVSIGAPASAFIQRNRQQLFANIPTVLTAVEQRRVRYSNLTDNDAVVAVRINYFAAIENILKVLPDTKNVTVVVGASPIEQFWKEAIGKEIEPLSGRVGFSWADHLSFDELLKHASSMPPHSALFWELMIVDAKGAVYEGDTTLAKLRAVSNAPIFSYDESFFGGQIVGGPLLLIADTSRQTAAVAVRILGGEKAGDIETPLVEFSKPMFDWRELQRWGISESRLPPGSTIHFREPSAWERYRAQILAICAALLLQAGLISWLIYEHWRRQVAETNSLQRLNELARMNRFATAGALSASIAHEIRQPLAAISIASSAGLNWLKNAVPNLDEARAALQSVVAESHRADEVIKGVRAMFSRKSTVHSRLDLNELVHQVIVLTARAIDANHIVVRTSFCEETPIISADLVQLQQVVLNLIMNAVEAMSSSNDGARILHVETAIDDGNVVLTIEDSGPGLDPRVAAKLFSPFVTTKPGGMGMGLSISKSIVEQHEGQLTAVSRAPRGMIFRLTLPRSQHNAAVS